MIAWHDGSLYLVYHLTERRAREEWFLLREVKKIKGGPMREQIRSSEEKESQGCGTYRIQAVNAQCSTLFFQIAFLDYNLRICCSGTSLSNTISFHPLTKWPFSVLSLQLFYKLC